MNKKTIKLTVAGFVVATGLSVGVSSKRYFPIFYNKSRSSNEQL